MYPPGRGRGSCIPPGRGRGSCIPPCRGWGSSTPPPNFPRGFRISLLFFSRNFCFPLEIFFLRHTFFSRIFSWKKFSREIISCTIFLAKVFIELFFLRTFFFCPVFFSGIFSFNFFFPCKRNFFFLSLRASVHLCRAKLCRKLQLPIRCRQAVYLAACQVRCEDHFEISDSCLFANCSLTKLPLTWSKWTKQASPFIQGTFMKTEILIAYTIFFPTPLSGGYVTEVSRFEDVILQ